MSDHIIQRPTLTVPTLKHLTLAMKYASDSWFPVAPDTITRIRTAIVKGTYERDCNALLEDIEQDHALSLYYMKEFLPKGVPQSLTASPFQLLREFGYQTLSEALCKKGLSYSVHSLRAATPEQVARTAHAIISTETSRLLSEARSVPTDLGCATAMLRQLGLSLVAWNYPHVYARAVASLKPGDTVDEKIGRVLGFTPTTLALKLTAEWHLSPLVRFSMGDSASLRQLETDSLKNFALTLSQTCAVGEALARAHDPRHYPSAASDWEFARQEICATLGSRGMEEIASWIRAHCAAYESVVGSLFPTSGTTIFTLESVEDDDGPSVYDACQPPLREALDEFAASLEVDTVSNESLQLLIKKVVPTGGFARGCVYLADLGSHILSPRLTLGDARIERFKPIDFLSGSDGGSPILAAFHAHTPIFERDIRDGDRTVTYFASALGRGPRVGVLYLEVFEQIARHIEPQTLEAHFEAIHEAFEAVLFSRR